MAIHHWAITATIIGPSSCSALSHLPDCVSPERPSGAPPKLLFFSGGNSKGRGASISCKYKVIAFAMFDLGQHWATRDPRLTRRRVSRCYFTQAHRSVCRAFARQWICGLKEQQSGDL